MEFAEVKHVPLDDTIARAAPVFEDVPGKVLFAILESF